MNAKSKPPYVTWIAVALVGVVLVAVLLLKSDADMKGGFATECAGAFSDDVCRATLAEAHSNCLKESKPLRQLSEAEYRENPGNGRTEIGAPDPLKYAECMRLDATARTK